MLLDATLCATGGKAGEEVVDSVTSQALWRAGDFRNTWEEEVKTL